MEEYILHAMYLTLMLYLIVIVPSYTIYFVNDIVRNMLSEEKRLEMCDMHIQTDDSEMESLKPKNQ